MSKNRERQPKIEVSLLCNYIFACGFLLLEGEKTLFTFLTFLTCKAFLLYR